MPALMAEDTLQWVVQRVAQPAVEVAVIRALRLLPSNVARECAVSGQILIVTAFLRSPVQLSVTAAGQTRHM